MNITKKPKKFQSCTLEIEIETQEEFDTLVRMTRFDSSIPEVVQGGPSSDSMAPKNRKDITRLFLHKLNVALHQL